MNTLNWGQTLRLALHKYGAPKQYAALIRAHGASRKKAIDYICGIGGYYDRHEKYAVEWDVKAYRCDLDVLHLFRQQTTQPDIARFLKNPAHGGILFNVFFREYTRIEEHLWEYATCDAWENFESDSQTFWGADRDATFHLVGRSGGHLVMSECAGINLKRSDDDLRELLSERETEHIWSRYEMAHDKVVHLFLLCVETSVDWTTKTVGEEIEYHAAEVLWARVNIDEVSELCDKYDRLTDAFVDELRAGDADSINTTAAFLGLRA